MDSIEKLARTDTSKATNYLIKSLQPSEWASEFKKQKLQGPCLL